MSIKLEQLYHVKECIESVRIAFFRNRLLFDLLSELRTRDGELPEEKGYHEWINAFTKIIDYASMNIWKDIRSEEISNEREG